MDDVDDAICAHSLVLLISMEMGENTWMTPCSMKELMKGPYVMSEEQNTVSFQVGSRCTMYQAAEICVQNPTNSSSIEDEEGTVTNILKALLVHEGDEKVLTKEVLTNLKREGFQSVFLTVK